MSTTEVQQSAILDELLSRWESDGISNVLFELPDMHGTTRSKIVPLNKVRGFAEKGLNMYGGALTLDSSSFVISGTKYNEEVNYSENLKKVPNAHLIIKTYEQSYQIHDAKNFH